jgi:hypothetical protein
MDISDVREIGETMVDSTSAVAEFPQAARQSLIVPAHHERRLCAGRVVNSSCF